MSSVDTQTAELFDIVDNNEASSPRVRTSTSTQRASPRKLPRIIYYPPPARMSVRRSPIEDVVSSDDVPSLRPSIEGHTLTPTPGAPSRTSQTSPLRQTDFAEIADNDPKLLTVL
ncbi:uncharacterized protein LY89DRAFT_740284 [Mollisia scopiformis]|uniref:Uncharacterized protein n=1 Tax=Mollisia scopiformis TaxID=149040 RepID=A0A132BDT7_MOLSC|nr:uncharacterized protein LY89DRAFT_740284 [Mollisia scopiformis]KUJ10576.1 hypothetical protein LY89DRAFT_740284 [Mollisia scopiformis]